MKTKERKVNVAQKQTFTNAMANLRALFQSFAGSMPSGWNDSEALLPFAQALDHSNTIFSEICPGDFATVSFRIALHPSHKRGEWVTHMQNCESVSYDTGHYFDNFDDALLDYIARCKKHNLKTLLQDQIILHTN